MNFRPLEFRLQAVMYVYFSRYWLAARIAKPDCDDGDSQTALEGRPTFIAAMTIMAGKKRAPRASCS
jgi:hypothetical protein